MALKGSRTFVGFGFGPIQAGLFCAEAQDSGNFGRLVVADVDRELVDAVRTVGEAVTVNIAHESGIESREVGPVEIFDPADASDRESLIAAVAESAEFATALPHVGLYGAGGPSSVAAILAEGFSLKAGSAIVYTGENHTRAAELLNDAAGAPAGVLFLNTVIGKMSGVISGEEEIKQRGLTPLVSGLPRAYLVEAFNRIAVSRVTLTGFERGITAFEEYSDLRPLEEAKLYGHNAVHALAAYVGYVLGMTRISELRELSDAMDLLKAAFLEESGKALLSRHRESGISLMTPKGFAAYADDVVTRMTNPYLGDTVARVGRDPMRKLAWDDRLVGAMRLALEPGIRPWRFALGAAAALTMVHGDVPTAEQARATLDEAWGDEAGDPEPRKRIAGLVVEALPAVAEWRSRGFVAPKV